MAQTYTPAALQPGMVLTTTLTTVYTAPVGTIARISRAVFSNVSAAPVTITVNVTRAGQSGLVLIKNTPLAVAVNDTAPELAAMVLLPGDTLSAQASAAASVNVFISGLTVIG